MNGRLSERLARDGVSQTPYFNSLRDVALELLRRAKEGDSVGRRPCAMAASAIYSAELLISYRESRKKRLTQRELAECSDSAEYTIRDQCSVIFMAAVEEEKGRRLPAPPLPT